MMPSAPAVREAPASFPTVGNDPTRPDVRAKEPELNVGNIQGNVLAGFNKDHQTHLYLRIKEGKTEHFRRWLARMTPFIATTSEVLRFNRLFKEIRHRRGVETGTVEATWINVALSYRALQLLVVGDVDGIVTAASDILGLSVGTATPENMSPDAFTDAAFKSGMAARGVAELGDPADETFEGNPKNWLFGCPDDEPDVVLIVAADNAAALSREVSAIEDTIFGGRPQKGAFEDSGLRVIYKQHGNTLPAPLTGHEHFGFLDGVSQPGVRGIVSMNPFDLLTLRQNVEEPLDQGKPGQDVLWPGEFVFGYPGQDPSKEITEPGPDSLRAGGPDGQAAGPLWAQDGSFVVIRRLRQDVPKFRQFMASQAQKLAVDGDLLTAAIVGRWKSGAPVIRTPATDIPALGDDDCANNHFEFGSPSNPITPPVAEGSDRLCQDNVHPQSPGDVPGSRCPFAAHIRKAYPRDDTQLPVVPSQGGTTQYGTPTAPTATPLPGGTLGESTTQTHRMLRRGIPFGPPYNPAPDPSKDRDTGERGLLFVSYQTSIVDQFEFVTKFWINNSDFKEPMGADGTVKSGHDLVIGQSNVGGSRARKSLISVNGAEHVVEASSTDEWVIPTGGGYFFAPSIAALRLLCPKND